MNAVYIRLALYSVAGLVAATGLGTFDAVAGTLTLQLDDLAAALAASSLVTGIVFAVWGKK